MDIFGANLRIVIGLFGERNVCPFEAAAWGRGALHDFGLSGGEGDYCIWRRDRCEMLRTQAMCRLSSLEAISSPPKKTTDYSFGLFLSIYRY